MKGGFLLIRGMISVVIEHDELTRRVSCWGINWI